MSAGTHPISKAPAGTRTHPRLGSVRCCARTLTTKNTTSTKDTNNVLYRCEFVIFVLIVTFVVKALSLAEASSVQVAPLGVAHLNLARRKILVPALRHKLRDVLAAGQLL